MSNIKSNPDEKLFEIWEKITNLSEVKGQTPSSMITLVIPPKYCI